MHFTGEMFIDVFKARCWRQYILSAIHVFIRTDTRVICTVGMTSFDTSEYLSMTCQMTTEMGQNTACLLSIISSHRRDRFVIVKMQIAALYASDTACQR